MRAGKLAATAIAIALVAAAAAVAALIPTGAMAAKDRVRGTLTPFPVENPAGLDWKVRASATKSDHGKHISICLDDGYPLHVVCNSFRRRHGRVAIEGNERGGARLRGGMFYPSRIPRGLAVDDPTTWTAFGVWTLVTGRNVSRATLPVRPTSTVELPASGVGEVRMDRVGSADLKRLGLRLWVTPYVVSGPAGTPPIRQRLKVVAGKRKQRTIWSGPSNPVLLRSPW